MPPRLPASGLALVTKAAELPPVFLAPSLQSTAAFSSSAACSQRNKRRGVSAIHRTGPRYTLLASKYPLPVPANVKRGVTENNPNHGLWGFFPSNRVAVPDPGEERMFGRPWSVQELRAKSFEDLHALWWQCVKERNRISTTIHERNRLDLGFGSYESSQRDETVRKTQSAIRIVLRERWYAWEDARKLHNADLGPFHEPQS